MNPDRYENFTQKLAGRVTNIVLLGFFTLLCSLPVVTIGASSTALHSSMKDYLINGNDKPLRTFFSAFKEYFGISTKVFLLNLVFIVILVWDLAYYRTGEDFIDVAGQAVSFSLLCMILFEMNIVFVVIEEELAHTVIDVFKKAFDIFVTCLLESFSIFGLFAAAVVVVVVILRPFLLVLPGVIAYLEWQIFPKMLKKYKFTKGNAQYQKERRKEK